MEQHFVLLLTKKIKAYYKKQVVRAFGQNVFTRLSKAFDYGKLFNPRSCFNSVHIMLIIDSKIF